MKLQSGTQHSGGVELTLRDLMHGSSSAQERAELIEVQQALQSTEIPNSDCVEITCWGRSTDDVGGDLHHVRSLDDHRIAFCVLDVTGHGAVAAIVAAYMRRSLIAAEAELLDCRPDLILQRLNTDLIDSGLASCRPVAAVYAILDEETGIASVARAGVPYPTFVEANEEPRVLAADGPLLGLLPDAQFELTEVTISQDDSLLLFSDGLEMLVAPGSSSHGLGEAHRSTWMADWGRFDAERCMLNLDHRWYNVPSCDRDDATVIAIRGCRLNEATPLNWSDTPTDAAAAIAV